MFRKVRRLELDFYTDRPLGWLAFVSKLIDLTTIVKVKVSSVSIRTSDPNILADITDLLEQTSRLSSLDICFGFFSRKSSLTAAEICPMIPSHVKHLAVSIKDLNEIKSILERLQHLSSANFYFDYTPSWNEITKWIERNRKGSSYQADSFSVCVWLGKNSAEPKVAKVGNKRIKRTDEHYQ